MRAGLMAAAGLLCATAVWAEKESHDAALTRNLQIFNSLVHELETNYVDSVRVGEAFEMAIASYLDMADPYTEYYTPDEKEGLMEFNSGEYGGIGATLTYRDGKTYISYPYKDSPAEKAGLKAGDRLLMVDTVDVSGMKSSEITKLLRGQPSSEFTARVCRPYVQDSILDIKVIRGRVSIPTVSYYGLTPDSIGFIHLNSFNEKSADEVEEALKSFQGHKGLKGIVLDLRNNGGGIMESAINIAGMFLPKGTEVLRTKGKDSEKIYKTTKQPIFPDIPLAVLINGNSASASEIVAGAMQDLDRAVLVGSRSFGKGLVQGTFPLPHGSALKVTTSKYYIPSGRLIQALDYSMRNSDGSVARTPDSLTHVYKTLHGREVRDGGGLVPDIKIDDEKYAHVVSAVVNDDAPFRFSVQYAAQNDILPPAQFEITDEIYEAFKKSIDPGKLKYDKPGETLIKNLREILEVEGYMDSRVSGAIDSLSVMLRHDLYQDMDIHRKQISPFLAAQIMQRKYYTSGAEEYLLKQDSAYRKAADIILDPAKRKEILKH